MTFAASVREASNSEKAFVVFVLLLSTGAFVSLGINPNVDPQDSGMAGMQVLWSVVYLVTVALIGSQYSAARFHVRNEWWLSLLILFVFASILWSDEPGRTSRRAVALLCSTIFGFYFAIRFPLKQQLRLVAGAIITAAALSVIFELFGLGTNVAVGDVEGWIGIYPQKNQLGLNMALGCVVLRIIRKADPPSRSWAGICFILTFATMLLARSATSLVMFLVAVSIPPVWHVSRTRGRLVVFIVLILLFLFGFVAISALESLDLFTGLLGRDVTLSGRVPLWALSTVMALQRPWLGYGYNAFWSGTEGTRINELLRWTPNSAHNGFLEVWLGLGVIGLGLFLIVFLLYFKRALGFMRGAPDSMNIWPITFLLLMFVSNLTQSSMLTRNNIFWILYIAVGLTTARVTAGTSEMDRLQSNATS